ncbi:MAG TPA: hypothetical protein VF173_15545 [Thermoanaerobaculia bacterium]|nr:hypothetical protein [Thermoanaerobaculia bacterium]
MSLRLLDNTQSLELATPGTGPYVQFGDQQNSGAFMKIGSYGNVNNIENTNRDLIIAGSGKTLIRTSLGLRVEGPFQATTTVLPKNPNSSGTPSPVTPTTSLGQVYWDDSSIWIYTGQWEKAQIGPVTV